MPSATNDYNRDDGSQTTTITMGVAIANQDLPTVVYYSSVTIALLMLTVIAFGLMGNWLSFNIFGRKCLRSSISILLAGLALTDACLLLLALATFVVQGLSVLKESMALKRYLYISTVALYPMLHMTKSCSIWLVMAITVERYIVVRYPLKARFLCTSRKAKIILAMVVCTAILYNIVRFWEYKVTYTDNGIAVNYNLRQNKAYMKVYAIWLYMTTQLIAPAALLVSLNGHIIFLIRSRANNQSRREFDRKDSAVHGSTLNDLRTTRMLIIIVATTLCSTILPMALTIVDAVDPNFPKDCISADPAEVCSADKRRKVTAYYLMVDTSNLLVIVNAALPFIVYCTSCTRFAEQLKLKIGRREQRKEHGNGSLENEVNMALLGVRNPSSTYILRQLSENIQLTSGTVRTGKWRNSFA